MNFYDINFEVKYHSIRDELLEKIASNNTNEYVEEDVFTICTNLYQHELTQVFYASSLLDNKIDKGIQYVYNEILSKYVPFTDVINNSKLHLFTCDDNNVLTSVQKENLEKNSSYFLLLMLFSENMFYLTHQCICQLTKYGRIELALLVNFETMLNEMLLSKF
uniref:Uncharacterized protein n=1 Tax=viral metagenome TaxID=1070528 RepID=A0A6C0IVA6_9ZZZZ